MTVCISAIAGGRMVIGAADRMLTGSLIEYEPNATKIAAITNAVAVTWSGDTLLNAEILPAVYRDVSARIEVDPTNWWSVADVADLWAKRYQRVRLKRAENELLVPLGLTMSGLLNAQHALDPAVVAQLVKGIQGFVMPSLDVLVSGLDRNGAHIYGVFSGKVISFDSAGFASVGSGSWHATSQLMFAKHSRTDPLAESLLLVYSAKKRSEVAPGVGSDTDMFMIGPELGMMSMLPVHLLASLDQIYQRSQERMGQASLEAGKEASEFINKLIAEVPTEPQTAESPDPPAATDLAPKSGDSSPSKATDRRKRKR